MGNRHRQIRMAEKAKLRQLGWRENEFGELSRCMTKADARRNLINRALARFEFERYVVETMSLAARNDIYAIEDASFFADMKRTVA